VLGLGELSFENDDFLDILYSAGPVFDALFDFVEIVLVQSLLDGSTLLYSCITDGLLVMDC